MGHMTSIDHMTLCKGHMISVGHNMYLLHRSHDKAIGRQFYQKLKGVRDSLGLSYRFEIIYDDGSQFVSISRHFYRRLCQWKGKRRQNHCVNGMSQNQHGESSDRHVIMSYKELENLPCLVILAGECRAGLSFPRYIVKISTVCH